jgi:hypothetical protein
MRRALGIAGLAAGIVATATVSHATSVQHLTLDQTVQRAERIVHATVTEMHSGRDDAGLPATWITLHVAQTLKGAQRKQFTIKQYGVAEPLPDGSVTRIAGLPRYAVGEEVVLFLHAESRRGFTSPVGLGQGCYRINRTALRPRVRREAGGGATDLDEFLSTVQRLTTADQ